MHSGVCVSHTLPPASHTPSGTPHTPSALQHTPSDFFSIEGEQNWPSKKRFSDLTLLKHSIFYGILSAYPNFISLSLSPTPSCLTCLLYFLPRTLFLCQLASLSSPASFHAPSFSVSWPLSPLLLPSTHPLSLSAGSLTFYISLSSYSNLQYFKQNVMQSSWCSG